VIHNGNQGSEFTCIMFKVSEKILTSIQA